MGIKIAGDKKQRRASRKNGTNRRVKSIASVTRHVLDLGPAYIAAFKQLVLGLVGIT